MQECSAFPLPAGIGLRSRQPSDHKSEANVRSQ